MPRHQSSSNTILIVIIIDVNPVDCDPLLPPPNGTVSFQNTTHATYLCDEGFILLGGYETRTCHNGAWSSTDPTCNCKLHNQISIGLLGQHGKEITV